MTTRTRSVTIEGVRITATNLARFANGELDELVIAEYIAGVKARRLYGRAAQGWARIDSYSIDSQSEWRWSTYAITYWVANSMGGWSIRGRDVLYIRSADLAAAAELLQGARE